MGDSPSSITAQAKEFIIAMLSSSLDANQYDYLAKTCKALEEHFDSMSFHLAYSGLSRKIPREEITQLENYRSDAAKILDSWMPHLSTKDTLARVAMLCSLPLDNPERAYELIWDAFDTADMWEQIGIFSALPILPYADSYVKIAAEGLRTNMAPVFDSIALDNPYPALHFSKDAWNQMYLKAAFMERPLHRIQSVQTRSNEALAQMILDYAEERWAAGREVSPEIWQGCSGHLNSSHIEALSKLSSHEEERQRAVLDILGKQENISEWTTPDLRLSKQWDWVSLGQSLI